MIRTLILLSCAVSLSGCDPAKLDHSLNVLEGKDDGFTLALLDSGSTEPVEVASSSEEPVVCEDYRWRYNIYNCAGEIIGSYE